MKTGYSFTIEQRQQLAMTPGLVQAIKMLQYTGQELDDYIAEQLLGNPLLEQNLPPDKEFLPAPALSQGDSAGYSGNADPEFFSGETGVSLTEHLMFQLQFADLTRPEKSVGSFIIESLDEDGYMTMSVREISRSAGADEKQVRKVLDAIRTFDPAGVGAEDLIDCLLIQLNQVGRSDSLEAELISNHLEQIATRDLTKVAKATGTTLKKVREAADNIKKLNPKPGSSFSPKEAPQYIVPDIVIEANPQFDSADKNSDGALVNEDFPAGNFDENIILSSSGKFIITMRHGNCAGLYINKHYADMLGQAETDPELAEYLAERRSAARFLINSIARRQSTISNVIKAIVDYQEDFLEKGAKHLKPLTLKQIAVETGIHQSTVSRAVSGKYMQTPRGVFGVKHMFSGKVSGDDADGVSTGSVKVFIRELIEAEDRKSPLSDQEILKLLENKGIRISRRTVAKYRDAMGIPSSSVRRRY